MGFWKTVVSVIGGRRVVLGLGGLYVALGSGFAVAELSLGKPLSNVLLVSLFIATPGALLLYGGEGIGIDPADQERIFELFQRLHTQEQCSGTDIGLALCRRIVERHGGDIRVESTPGERSTFSVTLPTIAE